MRKAADVYKRALAVLFLPTPPEEPSPVLDFRRLPDVPAGTWSPELRLEIRRLVHKRRIALALATHAPARSWPFVGSEKTSTDPEATGQRARGLIAITDAVQRSWKSTADALTAWRAAIERRGVFVFQLRRVPVEEMRGLSIAEAPFPVIAVNRKDAPVARIFSLLHEFIHVLVGRSGLCDGSDEPLATRDSGDIEVFCNAAAAATLMPRDSLLAHALVRSHQPGASWDEEALRKLGSAYRVSTEALLRRLVSLELASPGEYAALRRRLAARPPASADGGGPRERGHEIVLRTQATAYVRLVLEALGADAITAADAADYLDMKLDHLSALQASLANA